MRRISRSGLLWGGICVGSLLLMIYFGLYRHLYNLHGLADEMEVGAFGELIWRGGYSEDLFPLPRNPNVYYSYDAFYIEPPVSPVVHTYSLIEYLYAVLLLKTTLIQHLWWMWGVVGLYAGWQLKKS